jgi:hypothetical protein
VRANARALGISVFSSAEQAHRANWRFSRALQADGRLLIWQERKPIPAQELRERGSRFHALPARDRRLDVAIFTFAVFAFLALALFFLPGATVTLAPAEEDQQISLPVWAGPEIQVANPSGGLPARAVSVVVEGRDQKNSTGRLRVPDGAATGQVLLTNLTAETVEIPQGSIVLAGVLQFTTTRPVKVPAGLGQAQTVPVRALQAGSDGNVAAGAIRAMQGEKGLQVVVENPQPLSGGSDRSSPAPSPQDEQTLRASLLASLVLFSAGGLIGFGIGGADVRVPAHYHGCIVGVTLAMMGVTYLLLPRFGYAAPSSRWAAWQPWIFGAGQLMHITGLVISGGYGVQRKVAGAEQVLRSTPEVVGMGIMGAGGLLAIVGGLMFVVIVARALRRRP